MNNNKISTVTDPTNAQDAATKAYVDAKTDGTASGSFTNLAYTGTLTGGTGVVNIGSGQVYKDASGNVGIGTTGPTAQLQTNYGFSGKSLINAAILGGTDSGIGFTGIKVAYKDASALTSATSYPLQVFTNAAAQFSVTGNGRVLVNTTTASTNSLLYVAGSTGFGIDSSSATTNNNANGFFFQQSDGNFVTSHSNSFPTGNFSTYQYGGAVAGYIQGTSAGASVAYTSVSDYRLKENIAPMTGALATVAKLKPVTYTWKANGTKADGFIAHELQEVLPNAVSGEKDDVNEDGSIKPQGIDTSYIVATLTAAIQELKAEFDTYKASHP